MKVKDLIKELQEHDQELDVIVWGNELDDNYNIESIEVDAINKEELILNIH